MSATAKIRTLLRAWMDYIHLEDLSNAEVEAGSPEQPNIWDKGISLVRDQLLIDKSLFQDLFEQFKTLEKKGRQEQILLAVAFPQIYLVKKGQRKFRPLFTIDVSSILAGRYRNRGWDLTAFEFQPVLPNLMELYQLDEEEAENLVTREGLKVFLETTFSHSFSTLQDFLDLFELPSSPWRDKPSPYLLRFDFVPYNYNLKKDLQKISEQPFWDWAVTGHPAYEYLFGQQRSSRHEVLFLGAFPTEPPNDSQARALKHASENPLTAVIGPPGNGKTTLLLHAIAGQPFKRAYQLASTGIDQSNLTLVTSTNNRAVANVVERLAAEFPTDRFYLEGGSKALITKQVIPKLQAAIDWLETETFDQARWKQVSQQLLARVNSIKQQLKQDQDDQRQRERDVQTREQLRVEIRSLTDQIEARQLEPPPSSHSPDYSQYPFEAYSRILPQLERARQSLPRVEPDQLLSQADHWWEQLWGWLKKLWQLLTRTSTHHILNRLHKQIQAPLTATLATPFPFQLPLTRESLEAARAQVALQLKEAKERLLSQPESQLDSLVRQRDDLGERLQQVEQRLASYPSQDFYTRLATEHHQQQQQLFELSWQYLQQEALRRSSEVIASLKTYIGVVNPEGDYEARRKFASTWSSILRDVSLLFPVVASTLQSVRNLLPYPDSGCIERLIVDEAGMIPLHQLFPALVRSQKALVVGDPLQLEPIIPFSQQTLEQYHTEAFKRRGLTDSDYERYSPTAISTATAYHRAAGASGQSGDLGNGIILTEHHRCVPPIITFCDRLCNYGLTIKTPDSESKLGPNLIAYHVEGTYSNHTNPEEVEAVERLIGHLLDKGYCIDSPDSENTIGVISPYRRQADVLCHRLQSSWSDFNSDSIGTVHTFQGGQKSVIIFSTRQCRDSDSLLFINRRPNLLNVAVSRAQKLFILVGNLERLKMAGGYTRQLVDHIQQYGELRQLP